MRDFVPQEVSFAGLAAIDIPMCDAAPAYLGFRHGNCTNRACGIRVASGMEIALP